MREELDRLIGEMLDRIYIEGNDPVEEINFTINCLEVILDKEFTPKENVKMFTALTKIVMKAGNR